MMRYKSIQDISLLWWGVMGGLFLLQTSAIATPLHLESGTQQNTLIELYTSQGCSSCPPAERWLGKLQTDPRLWQELIPVAFHVDYWDYIGWKDELARPEYSQRQQRYRDERGIKSVYTPGFVINGREWRSWFGLRKIPVSERHPGQLVVDLDGARLNAYFERAYVNKERLTLNVAVVAVGITARVTRGENAGSTLEQDFVVLNHIQKVSENGSWSMQRPPVVLPAGARGALVAWVSYADALAPIQAVGGWLAEAM